MGNAALYWTPRHLGATLQTVDLGEKFTERGGPTPWMQTEIAESFAGHLFQVIFAQRSRIEVVLQDFQGNATLRRQLEALEGYLKRGGLVSVAEDSDLVWAGFGRRAFEPGDTAVGIIENQFEDWSGGGGGGVDLTNTEVWIQGPSPTYLHERALVSSHTPGSQGVTLSSGLVFDYSDEPWTLIRAAGFWPFMRVPKESRGQRFLTHVAENRFTWTLPLEESPEAISVASGAPEVGFTGTTQSTAPTIEEAVAGKRAEETDASVGGVDLNNLGWTF